MFVSLFSLSKVCIKKFFGGLFGAVHLCFSFSCRITHFISLLFLCHSLVDTLHFTLRFFTWSWTFSFSFTFDFQFYYHVNWLLLWFLGSVHFSFLNFFLKRRWEMTVKFSCAESKVTHWSCHLGFNACDKINALHFECFFSLSLMDTRHSSVVQTMNGSLLTGLTHWPRASQKM